jgi:hypothetical protein
MSDILNVADCPGHIKHRQVPQYRESPPGSGNVIFSGYETVDATYAWLFAADHHFAIGRRWISADNSPFEDVQEEGSPPIGYLCKINPWTGEVKWAEGSNDNVISEARLRAWLEAGILVDPNDY